MSFKDQIINDAVKTFLNGDEFAEFVLYTPSGGSEKVVRAVVDRKRLSPAVEDSGRALLGGIEAVIARHADFGIEIVTTGPDADTVVVTDPNGKGERYFVADILGFDEGMWHLLLQK